MHQDSDGMDELLTEFVRAGMSMSLSSVDEVQRWIAEQRRRAGEIELADARAARPPRRRIPLRRQEPWRSSGVVFDTAVMRAEGFTGEEYPSAGGPRARRPDDPMTLRQQELLRAFGAEIDTSWTLAEASQVLTELTRRGRATGYVDPGEGFVRPPHDAPDPWETSRVVDEVPVDVPVAAETPAPEPVPVPVRDPAELYEEYRASDRERWLEAAEPEEVTALYRHAHARAEADPQAGDIAQEVTVGLMDAYGVDAELCNSPAADLRSLAAGASIAPSVNPAWLEGADPLTIAETYRQAHTSALQSPDAAARALKLLDTLQERFGIDATDTDPLSVAAALHQVPELDERLDPVRRDEAQSVVEQAQRLADAREQALTAARDRFDTESAAALRWLHAGGPGADALAEHGEPSTAEDSRRLIDAWRESTGGLPTNGPEDNLLYARAWAQEHDPAAWEQYLQQARAQDATGQDRATAKADLIDTWRQGIGLEPHDPARRADTAQHSADIPQDDTDRAAAPDETVQGPAYDSEQARAERDAARAIVEDPQARQAARIGDLMQGTDPTAAATRPSSQGETMSSSAAPDQVRNSMPRPRRSA